MSADPSVSSPIVDGGPTPPPTPRWQAHGKAVLGRFVFATLAGLLLAGIVHIVIVLLIPVLSQRDATSAYLPLGAGGQAQRVTGPTEGLAPLRDTDPAAVVAVCGYELANGPMRIVARTGTLPMSLTLHRRGGGVIYAITDRAAIRNMLEFLVLTEEQLDARLAREDEGEPVRELRIVSDTRQGLVVARVLAKQPSDQAEAQAQAGGVACGPAE